jgi:small subunit ribosomal protein S16
MSVKIRLQRGGRKNLPVYSIVVADSRSGRDSKFIERIGFYAPKARGQEVPFSINEERVTHWVGLGAQVTDVVTRLMIKANIGPESVRADHAARKERRIKVAALKAAKIAKGEELKGAAAAKAEAEAAKAAAAEAKAAEEAAAKAAAEAAKAEAEAAKAAAEAAPAEVAAAEGEQPAA